ncbi:pilus assembly protein TadG-related protein [Streptomyces sp. NPDC051567]|uniref:pilus assembly protein TadG-related protein n=1 Tax=Streptomyces sp. NPDC051567 TaxID=3365660 RepID=UPI0037AC757F
MKGPWRRDRGQVFPLYVGMVAILMFAALAFFVVGRASVIRSDAQGAADAAALAAARDARDHLVPGLDLALLTPEEWKDVLAGNRLDTAGACAGARRLAALNAATVTCTGAGLRFRVEAVTEATVGDSVVPGTAGLPGRARASALVEPRCGLGPVAAEPGPAPSSGPTPSPGPAPSPSGGGAEPGPSVVIRCEGADDISFDPSRPRAWESLARTLFRVRLVE